MRTSGASRRSWGLSTDERSLRARRSFLQSGRRLPPSLVDLRPKRSYIRRTGFKRRHAQIQAACLTSIERGDLITARADLRFF